MEVDQSTQCKIVPRWVGMFAIACITTFVTGCMTVHIQTDAAPVAVVRHFGVLQVQVSQADQAVVGALTGVGVAATPMGWTAGFTRQRWATFGPACRAVLWVDAGVDDALLQEMLRLSGACLLTSVGTPLPQTAANNEVKR